MTSRFTTSRFTTSRFTTRPELRGTFGAVSSTHWLASSVGMSLLEGGGNAFDAAVAAGFTLQVVEPHLNGPGGEVPILACPAGADAPIVICGQGVAPAAATPAHFRDLGLDRVPGTGLLPACVPGAFGAWLVLLRDHGTRRLRDVLGPAIGYARHGHPLVPRIAGTIGAMCGLFETHWPTSAAIYLPGGRAPEAGRLFRNPMLADCYERLLAEAETAPGREAQIERALAAWYRGPVAEAIERHCQSPVHDVTGRAHRGLLTADDLARWQPTIERPVHGDHGAWRVYKCGPWSQGPVFLQALALVGDTAGLDPLGADFVHRIVEATKLAMADREAWYGDAAPVPLAALLDPAYAAARRRLIGDEASLELRPGRPEGREPRLPPLWPVGSLDQASGSGGGEPTVAREDASALDRAGEPALTSDGAQRGDTCHVDAVDRWGNMVAATPSGGWFQSSPVIDGLGFGLTTRGQMFWLQEGLASSLAPGRRPRTTLTPSFAFREGRPALAFGTPGGDQQDQWSLVMFLLHADHGLNLQEAIDAPSFHTEHVPSSFWPREMAAGAVTVEDRFPAETIAQLERRGHRVTLADPWSEGRLCACAREPDGDTYVVKAAANPRGVQGYAVAR